MLPPYGVVVVVTASVELKTTILGGLGAARARMSSEGISLAKELSH